MRPEDVTQKATPDEGSKVDPPSAIQSASPKRKGQPKGKSAKARATAWAQRNQALRRRRSLTITEASVAIEIWDRVKRFGEPRKSGRPKGTERRAAVQGDSIERQVYEKVQLEYEIVGPAGDLEAAVAAWLPCTFYAPLPPLCDAELLALAKEDDRDSAAVDAARDRLLPGFVREDVTQ